MANFGTFFSHFVTILTIVSTICACQVQDGVQGISTDEGGLQGECDNSPHMTLMDFATLASPLTTASPPEATLAPFLPQTDDPDLVPTSTSAVLFPMDVGDGTATLAPDDTSATFPTSQAQPSTDSSASDTAAVALLGIIAAVGALGGAAISLCITFICLRRRRSRTRKIKPIDVERDGTVGSSAGSRDTTIATASPFDTPFTNTDRSNDLTASQKKAGKSHTRTPGENPFTDQVYVLGYNTNRRRNTMAFIRLSNTAQHNAQDEIVLEDRRSERVVQLSVSNASSEGDESGGSPSGAPQPPPEYLSIFPTRKGKLVPQQGKRGIAM
ncbi:hypothetical protein CPC08DRAFT_714233 [Agrocybe pediades]|nr:hypothetical protein CPC08DRAFT_714233 [Agrocybe pediades]